jgi:hypothetical protein
VVIGEQVLRLSPFWSKNAERLLSAFERAMKKKGEPQSIEALKEEVGLG